LVNKAQASSLGAAIAGTTRLACPATAIIAKVTRLLEEVVLGILPPARD
jgi:hypothetical protein